MVVSPETTPDGSVCLCVIGPAHGVKGAVKAKCFAENAADLTAYGALQTADGQAVIIASVKSDKYGALLTLEGVSGRDAAEALRGTALYVARDKLPALDGDDFYHADLIGLAVVDADGATLGQVKAVHNFGAGDLLEIVHSAADRKGTAFYPFTKAVVPDIDIAAGRLVLLPPREDEARPPEQVSAGSTDDKSDNQS